MGSRKVDEAAMQLLCTLPRPGPRFRVVIVIVIYVIISRLAPGDTVPIAAGGILGLLAAAPARCGEARNSGEVGR
jgi:hypothetical protein